MLKLKQLQSIPQNDHRKERTETQTGQLSVEFFTVNLTSAWKSTLYESEINTHVAPWPMGPGRRLRWFAEAIEATFATIWCDFRAPKLQISWFLVGACVSKHIKKLRSASSDSSNGSDAYSSSTSQSSDESESSESEVKTGVGHVALSVSTLQSMHAMSTLNSEELSTFAQQGVSRKRIKAILNAKVCPCSCSMPQSALVQVCDYFWRLPKTAQDAVLWSIQVECSQRRRQWYLQGQVRSLESILDWLWMIFSLTFIWIE